MLWVTLVLTEIKGTIMKKSMKIKFLLRAQASARELQKLKCSLKSGQLFSRAQTLDKNNSDKLQHHRDSEFCLRNFTQCM